MATLLLAVGVGLVIFGAVVLIRYSDRPGGSLKWMGMEISSKGAGLPLIALGIAAIAFTITRPAATGEDPSPAAPGAPGTTSLARLTTEGGEPVPECLAAVVAAVPAERMATVEVGMRDLDVVSSPQPLDLPVALLLTENGSPVGAVRLRLYRGTDQSSDLFKVEAAVDASCQPAALHNTSRGGDPRTLTNWDTLRLRLGAADYHLRIGTGGEQVRLNFSRAS